MNVFIASRNEYNCLYLMFIWDCFELTISKLDNKVIHYIFFFINVFACLGVLYKMIDSFKILIKVICDIDYWFWSSMLIWSTCRLENTLNYGLERVWAIGYVKGSRRWVFLPAASGVVFFTWSCNHVQWDDSVKSLWILHVR